MTQHAIQVEGLSKLYTIGEKQQPYRTLRDTVSDAIARPLRALRRNRVQEEDEETSVWALKDVAFEINRGDVVGVIGRNGAGKSTLLKVLSRITEPSSGYADIYGRVGTLLEVGTGFHNELTGRENIYLNGAILGMKRADIQRQFHDIVAFAEVEKFVDTPVKHYSSGMYLRLAFAVAAHLDPEILFVDEVLAVGDLAFQNKCLGKMGDVARQGRTILFVSHNMGAVRSLCSTGLVLSAGKLAYAGDITSSIETYHRLVETADKHDDPSAPRTHTSGFSKITLESHGGSTIEQADEMELSTTLHLDREVAGFIILCVLEDMNQRRVLTIRRDSSTLRCSRWKGSFRIHLRIPALWLEPGLYTLYFRVVLQGQSMTPHYMSDVFHLDVGGRSSGSGSILSPKVEWTLEEAGHREEVAIV